MPKLPNISGSDAIKALEKLGFRQLRQSGSHVILRKELPGGAIGTVVPLHKELSPGTLRGILKLANVALDDFLKVL